MQDMFTAVEGSFWTKCSLGGLQGGGGHLTSLALQSTRGLLLSWSHLLPQSSCSQVILQAFKADQSGWWLTHYTILGQRFPSPSADFLRQAWGGHAPS